MNGGPRIKDIAQKLGVSPATVSRALSGSDVVARATRERILDAARDLDYRPNVSARNLRTRRAMAVLMVVRNIANPFYLEILKGAEAAARAAGYSVLMGNTEDDPAREAEYFGMLRDGHADGMILMTGKLPEAPDTGGRLPSSLPVVVALETIQDASFPSVQIDNTAAARDAVQHLLDLGHTRIAHICGPLPEVLSVKRREGYRAAMSSAGLAVPCGYEQRGDFLLHSGRRACRALSGLPQPPTAIFAANDEMAFGAIHELRSMGRDVPRDVSIVGFDDVHLSEAFYPPLTTVSQPRLDIGRRAMAILLEILAGGSGPEASVVLPTTLRVRGTTGPAAQTRPNPTTGDAT